MVGMESLTADHKRKGHETVSNIVNLLYVEKQKRRPKHIYSEFVL